MTQFRWIEAPVPGTMKIRQVYCVIIDRQGRVMLRAEKTPEGFRYSLAGGRPEPYDHGMEDTCRREVLEEVNTEIETPVYIGYQLADEGDELSGYAQVRMAALIRKIGERRPDPDNGKTYDRLLAAPEKAAELLNWGEAGYSQIMAAREAIYSRYGIAETDGAEEWV